jgi:hypothetical protein
VTVPDDPVGADGGADILEAASDDVQSVFGGIEQDAAGTAHREAPQTGDAGSDGNGQIGGEEGFCSTWARRQ